MRLIIIRHGDPDYENDTVTEKGKREVELLAKRMKNEPVDAIYVSPLGRAKDTARPTEVALGIDAVVCDWLREFSYETVDLPYKKNAICWDLLPEFVNTCEDIYSPTRWREVPFIKKSGIPSAYDNVTGELDKLLAEYGYVREGYSYRAVKPSHKTVVLVCHYGVTAVLLSRLLNCSPYSIWNNCVTLPTSVTVLNTEERRDGIASFRMSKMGDTSHLYADGEPDSFAARFCECYSDDTRHG